MLTRLKQRIYKLIVPDFRIIFDWGNLAPSEINYYPKNFKNGHL